MGEVPEHARYWGGPRVAPRPGAQSAVTELLERSIDSGATIAAIGPYTNLWMGSPTRPGFAGLGPGDGLERPVRHRGGADPGT